MYAAFRETGFASAAARSKLPKRGRRRTTVKTKITTRSVLLFGWSCNASGHDYDEKKMRFCIGVCEAATLEVERFATPFNSDCF